ncbi:MAG: DUF6585 family protein [Acidobacteriota bacterium]
MSVLGESREPRIVLRRRWRVSIVGAVLIFVGCHFVLRFLTTFLIYRIIDGPLALPLAEHAPVAIGFGLVGWLWVRELGREIRIFDDRVEELIAGRRHVVRCGDVKEVRVMAEDGDWLDALVGIVLTLLALRVFAYWWPDLASAGWMLGIMFGGIFMRPSAVRAGLGAGRHESLDARPTGHVHLISTRDDVSIELSALYQSPGDAIDPFLTTVHRVHLQESLAKLVESGHVTFGPLRLERHALRFEGGDTFLLERLQLELRNGRLVARRPGHRYARDQVPIADIPNLSVLLALVDRARRGELPAPAPETSAVQSSKAQTSSVSSGSSG